MRRKVWKVEPTGTTNDVAKYAFPTDSECRLSYLEVEKLIIRFM